MSLLNFQVERQVPLLTACELSGFSFKQSEIKEILTVSDFVSMSHPFIINVKKHVDEFNIDSLVEIVFHEVTHTSN